VDSAQIVIAEVDHVGPARRLVWRCHGPFDERKLIDASSYQLV
jgi:hypothetical protein